MRIALINSGLGLLTAAAEVHRLRPDADLILAMDPDGMPWGPRTPDDIAARSLACARAAAALDPDVLIFACNSGSVHALGPLRAEFEPGIPVVGTVPAIKPAAAHSDSVAIWATAATTGSAYQHRLIADFAASADVTEVACPGLADAIHLGDTDRASAIITESARRTPPDCGAVVLGCTEYELAAELIDAAVPGAVLFGSAAAVAAQALRRLSPPHPPAGSPASGSRTNGSLAPATPATGLNHNGLSPTGPQSSPPLSAVPGAGSPPTSRTNGQHSPAGHSTHAPLPSGGAAGGATLAAVPDAPPSPDEPTARTGQVWVILSGRHAELPAAALSYPAGRLVAALPHGPAPTPRAWPRTTTDPATASAVKAARGGPSPQRPARAAVAPARVPPPSPPRYRRPRFVPAAGGIELNHPRPPRARLAARPFGQALQPEAMNGPRPCPDHRSSTRHRTEAVPRPAAPRGQVSGSW